MRRFTATTCTVARYFLQVLRVQVRIPRRKGESLVVHADVDAFFVFFSDIGDPKNHCRPTPPPHFHTARERRDARCFVIQVAHRLERRSTRSNKTKPKPNEGSGVLPRGLQHAGCRLGVSHHSWRTQSEDLGGGVKRDWRGEAAGASSYVRRWRRPSLLSLVPNHYSLVHPLSAPLQYQINAQTPPSSSNPKN